MTDRVVRLATRLAASADDSDCPTGYSMVETSTIDELREALGMKRWVVKYEVVRYSPPWERTQWATSDTEAATLAMESIVKEHPFAKILYTEEASR